MQASTVLEKDKPDMGSNSPAQEGKPAREDAIPQELAGDGTYSGVEEEEGGEYPFEADKITISSVPVPVSRLLERLKNGSISAPPIQRSDNLWNETRQSRLLESLMLRIPLPLFYVGADNDENWTIVDGLQRISALRNFLLNKSFRLRDLEFLDACNGCAFDGLPAKYQNRIMDTTLQFAVIGAGTPPAVQRNIFKRLNTGGLPLSQQEIRHALYYDEKVASLLLRLSTKDEFIKATNGSINDSRMAARELCLRFTAFLMRGLDAYPKNGDMDSFLSDTMLLLAALPEMREEKLKKLFGSRRKDINTNITFHNFEELENKFAMAMDRAGKLFGPGAFRKSLDRERRSPVNKALFETVGIALIELEENIFQGLLQNREALFNDLRAALEDDLGLAISRDSHKPPSIKKRFSWFRDAFAKYGGKSA